MFLIISLSKLAPQAELHGIDYSSKCLSVARRINRRLVDRGQVVLCGANVSYLPYDNGRFDLALAVNSHYFWPDLKRDLREIMRVLQSGGALALAGGEYFGGKHDARIKKLAANGRMNCQTLPELREIMYEAGYMGVVIHEEWNKGWFCVIGSKPLGGAEESTPHT